MVSSQLDSKLRLRMLLKGLPTRVAQPILTAAYRMNENPLSSERSESRYQALAITLRGEINRVCFT